MSNRIESYALVRRWLADAVSAAEAAGVSAREYLASDFFGTLARRLLGGSETVSAFTRSVQAESSDEVALLLATDWAARDMNEAGVMFSAKALMELYKTNARFRRRCDDSLKFRVERIAASASLDLSSISELEIMSTFAGHYVELAMLDNQVRHGGTRTRPQVDAVLPLAEIEQPGR